MTYDEVLDQLNILTAQVKDLIAEKEEKGELIEYDGLVERIIDDDGDSYVLKASGGYVLGVEDLCHLTDTGNGFIAYFPSYSNCIQDNYICMGYDEADALRKLLTYIHKKQTNE